MNANADPRSTVATGRPRCWRVERMTDGTVRAGLASLAWRIDEPAPAGEVVIRVEAAGFNYKDALACSGHAGVMRPTTLVPGIDVAGIVERPVDGLAAGTAVVVTGNGMGESRDGGFATHLRTPVAAVIPRPPLLSAVGAMALGTAGLTAVLACDRLAQLVDGRHAKPDEEWLVTGASGGVGMLAVAMLAAKGQRVVACSRKPAAREPLARLGAAEVLPPKAVVDPSSKSLAKGRWAGVVDTVGGGLLADVLRSVRTGGAVTVIGMAGGVDLVTTVHPFILRGVTLAGIDAATQPTQADRAELWMTLARFWPQIAGRFPVTQLGLDDVEGWARRMLAGETIGRGVVVPS
ncbi:MAG: zinc-binding dehydrogenase [Planctomycetia bacterium]|nr:zinc-binding dehydrogenase [Planctomycetia bacterium]